MADTAARWSDRVLPHVPWRQWVLSLPFPLRFKAAWDPQLLTQLLKTFQAAIGMRLRAKAKMRGLRSARHGAVTVVQRFGGALNLNVHFHSMVADGVWVNENRSTGLPAHLPNDEGTFCFLVPRSGLAQPTKPEWV